MKKSFLILTFCFLTVMSSLAQGLAKSCSSIQGITAITLTKSMLSIAEGSLGSGPLDFEDIIDKLDQIEIVTASDRAQAARARNIVNTYCKERSDFETLVNIVDDGDCVDLYMRRIPSGSAEPLYEYLIIVASDDDEYTAVLLIGSITPSDLSSSIDINI